MDSYCREEMKNYSWTKLLFEWRNNKEILSMPLEGKLGSF